jgi:hypothetical protein
MWFKRGWTLQELLAPQRVEFFNSVWVEIGTKSSLQADIAFITGINDLFGYKDASVAQKMSWAANRETTRIEDQAYCLMGLFEVNMPPLYGEGRNAFLRLQLEILNRTDDETIFAWSPPTHTLGQGILAHSPKYFEGCGKFERGIIDPDRAPPSMTSRGLRMELLVIRQSDYNSLLSYAPFDDAVLDILPQNMRSTSSADALAPLNCKFGNTDLFLSLPLVQSSTGWTRGAEFTLRTMALSSLKLAFSTGQAEKKVIWAKQTSKDPISFSSISQKASSVMFRFERISYAGLSFSQRYFLGSYEHPGWVDHHDSTILLKGPWFPDRPAALRLVGSKNFSSLAIIIGKSLEDLFWLDIQPMTGSEALKDIAERVSLNRKGRIGPDRVHWGYIHGESLVISLKRGIVAGMRMSIVDMILAPTFGSCRLD